MQTHLSQRSALILLGGFFCTLALVGAIVVSNYDISFTPKQPTTTGCTKEAQLCPDGTTVGRVLPACNFAPCPGESATISPPDQYPTSEETSGGAGGTVSIVPVQPGQSAMAQIPDLPLGALPEPSPPLTIKFLVEHRTALNGKRVAVTGLVILNKLQEEQCTTKERCALSLMYMPPQIMIADTQDPSRNTLYDVTVMFPEEARNEADQYPVGSTTTVTATVEGSIDGIRLIR